MRELSTKDLRQKLLLLILVFCIPVFSFATFSPQCDISCIDCSDIDGLVGNTGSSAPPGSANGVHCTLTEHQIQWYGFIAGSEDITLEFTVGTCVNGSNFEVALISADQCEDYELIGDCYGGPSSIPGNSVVEVSNDEPLVVGQYYWLVFDATNSAGNCDFSLSVIEGMTGSVPITEEPEISHDGVICAGQTAEFYVSNEVLGAPEFNWYLEGILLDSALTFEYTFDLAGVYTLCAEGVSFCETGPQNCVEIEVFDPSESEVRQVICSEECLDYENMEYCSNGNFTVIIPNAAGCDSTIDLTIYELSLSLELDNGDCTVQGVELNFDYESTILPQATGEEIISWDWYYNGNIISGSTDENPFYAILGGAYSVIATISLDDVTCSEEIMLELNLDEYAFYFLPEEEWLDACQNDTVVYSLNTQGYIYPDEFSVFWEVPSGANIISGQGSPDLEVDWNDSEGGDLCYTVTNNCATTQPFCFEIGIGEFTLPSIVVGDSICTNESAIIELSDLEDNPVSISWLIGTATLISGDLNSAEPIEVSWDQAGVVTIEALIDFGCGPELISTETTILENDVFPPSNCFNDGSSLSILWDDDPNISNYSVSIFQGPVGVLSDSSYIVEGLAAGDTIAVQIMAEGRCGLISSDTLVCIVASCPSVDLTIESDFPDSICINDAMQILDFNIIEQTGQDGTGVFSGNGITDEIEGIFDVGQAGAGLQIIDYYFTYSNGLCTAQISDSIFILDEPMYNVQLDTNFICAGDTAAIQITGLTGLENVSLVSEESEIIQANIDLYYIIWDSSGSKLIEVEIQHAFCGNYSYSEELEVFDVPIINIECLNAETNEITIDWNTDPYFSNYQILLNDSLVTEVDSAPFTFTDLVSNTEYEISIIPLSDNICNGQISTSFCSTEACAPIDLSISGFPNQIICSNSDLSPFQLNLDYDESLFDGSEIIVWEGNFITSDGLVDPSTAVGQIFDNYVSISAFDCVFRDTLTLSVEEVPELALMGQSEICIEDEWELNYIGDDLMDYSFSWIGMPSTVDLSVLDQHFIQFSSPGQYNITLEANSDNCIAEPTDITVNVLDSVRTVDVTCTSGSDFIQLEWTIESSECNGDFSILLDGVPVSMNQTEQSLTLDNLDINTTYAIEIITNSNCLCQSKSIIIECTTEECQALDLEISSVSTVFCLDAFLEDIQLTSLLNGTEITNDLTWSGPGIDPQGLISVDDIPNEGSYLYQLNYQLSNCSYNAEIQLDFIESPIPNYIVTNPNCPGEMGSLTIVDIDQNTNYYVNGTQFDPSSEYILSPGSYELEWEKLGVCSNVVEFEILTPNFSEFEIDGPSIVQFGVQSNYQIIDLTSNTIDSIVWSYNGNQLIGESIDVIWESSTELCATIYYNGSCQSDVCLNINVQLANIYIPNVISLDRNSPNNKFDLFSNDSGAFVEVLQILDRWGNIVFDRRNLNINDDLLEWDGRLNGEYLSLGVYVYRLEIVFSSGARERFVGDITLLE